MDNIHYISEAEPNPPADEIGMFENGYDPRAMDDSLLLDLDNSDWKKRIEYRYHKRYQLTEDAFALIRSIDAETQLPQYVKKCTAFPGPT